MSAILVTAKLLSRHVTAITGVFRISERGNPFPSLPFPFPSPPLPLPSSSPIPLLLSSLPLEVGPLNPARGLGERC